MPVETAQLPTGGPAGAFRRIPARTVAVAALVLLASAGCTDVTVPPEGEVGEWPLAGEALEARSRDGVVVAGHPLAARVGVEVLEAGGNAVDAAVATGFALAVVLPEAGNLGGGGFLVYRAADGTVRTLDYREKAPAAATRDMYLDEEGEPTDRSRVGHLASGVPGSVAGLWEMHRELGSLPWADLVESAIALARSHVVDQVRHDHLRSAAERLSRFEASAGKFLPSGEPPSAGESWSQPDLARTLEAIRDDGRDGFYSGPVAELIVEEMGRGDGIITADDLAAYEPVWRDPVELDYRGHTVYSMPPPSSGGVTLALILNILEGFEELPVLGSADLVHLQAEAMRRAFIDRNRLLGDPDFVDLPLERLQSQEYADSLRRTIDPERATATPAGALQVGEGDDTTHYSVVDATGAAVAITTTINSSFGSGVTVAGAGFLLNNEMDDFAVAPGRPNQFGLVEGENNTIAPGKRMLSSMAPSIVLDPEGELLLVLGTPGGPTIITSVFQVISSVLDHDLSLAAGVERPRIHHQALPDRILYERDGLESRVVERLEAMGHELQERSGYSGDVTAVRSVDEGFLGVADPRRGAGVAIAGSAER